MRCLILLFGCVALYAQPLDVKNVARLKVAWTYHTGALDPPSGSNRKAAFESTPILEEGTLYLTTPYNQVIALDPASGAEKWKFDPQVDRARDYSEVTNRGVAAWSDPQAPRNAACRLRIFEGTVDARLLAIDGKTGKLCYTVDLTAGVDLRDRGDYQVTSAPSVAGDLVITGSSIGDNRAVDVERGIVRAYEARTGKLRWTWDPISWANRQKPRTGAANAWSTFSVDPQRDLVFIPTGSAAPDYYGGPRPGNNEHANSVVALKTSTGELVWSFQVVHHDLWDYDVASRPVLIDFQGRPAVAVTTKMGNLFVLDRVNGKPLMKVEERPVPQSDVPGEEASPTQPFPAWPAMVPQKLSLDDLWGPTPQAREYCRKLAGALRNEGMFTPPSLQGTLVFPGNVGGVNWGGASWDPQRDLLFANTNRLAAIIRLIPRDQAPAAVSEAKRNLRDVEFGRQTGTPYVMSREYLVSPGPVPCNAPPWGALVAFDLRSGKLRWETPLGEMIPGSKSGSPNLGGPLAVAGGLVFTAAAMDTWLRAFDSSTGAEVWKAELPASAQSTPMMFELKGKQYIVICAGGHGKLGTKMGDAVVAFGL
jgi:quinoprotein glucose dehydrogenase